MLPPTQAGNSAEPVINAVDSTVNLINSSSSNAVKPAQTPTIFATATQVAKPDTSKAAPPPSSTADVKLAKAETEVKADVKTDPKAAAPKEDPKAADPKADAKAEPKKEEPAKDEKKEEPKKDEKKDESPSNKDSGAKKDEPVRKLYCN